MPASDSASGLVERARRGDQLAFAELIRCHRPLAVRLCAQVLGDAARAEDAVQEAVLVAWLNLSTLRRAARFGAWLAGIALRVCHGWLRYQAREAWSLESLVGGRLFTEPVDPGLLPLERAELAELSGVVRRAVAQLPPGQRSAVALFYLLGLSHAECAALLGIEVGAVKARLHKARGRLRALLSNMWSSEVQMAEFVEVDVEDVRAVPVADRPGERRVVLLTDPISDHVLPIWVGQYEGDAIAISLVGAEAPRPLTFAFAAGLLEAAGGRVAEIRVSRLTDETFYAQVAVASAAGSRMLDARPSDAIALALVTGSPIRVASEVMQMAGRTRDELAASRPAESRSAREHAAAIREVVALPTGMWARSGVF